MEIKLNGNTKCCVLVSESDFNDLSKYKWYLRKNGYAGGHINNKMCYLHTYLLKPNGNLVVDHINNNKLDNRRENLRISTVQQNMENKKIYKSKKSSIYRGVFYSNKEKKYKAKCTHTSKIIHIGSFIKEIDAAEARDMYIIHNNLEHMGLNFPEKKELYLNKQYIGPKEQTNKNNYKGVVKKKYNYQAQIKINRKYVYICASKNPLDCAKAYDKYIVDNHVQSKRLNFPQDYPNYNPNCVIKTFYKEIDNKTIELHNNIIIDKDDYDKIKNFKINISKHGYPMINILRSGKTKKVHTLSRFLIGITNPQMYIDHINNNRLDNTKKNLRIVTPQGNAQNRIKCANSFSQFIGIIKNKGAYCCRIKKNNIMIFNGYDINEEIVVKYRDIYIMEYLKEDCYKLNLVWNDRMEMILWKNILIAYMDSQKTNKIKKLYNKIKLLQ